MYLNHVELIVARDILYPRIWDWREWFLDAFDFVQGQDPGFLRPLIPSTIAGMVCDHAYDRIERGSLLDPGVAGGVYSRQRHLWVDGTVCVRIKKLNRNFLSSNYPTRQATEWNAQLPLPGFPPGSRVELGYQVDLTGSVLRGLFVLLRLGHTIQWLWQIYGEQVSTFGSQPQLTLAGAKAGEPVWYLYEVIPLGR